MHIIQDISETIFHLTGFISASVLLQCVWTAAAVTWCESLCFKALMVEPRVQSERRIKASRLHSDVYSDQSGSHLWGGSVLWWTDGVLRCLGSSYVLYWFCMLFLSCLVSCLKLMRDALSCKHQQREKVCCLGFVHVKSCSKVGSLEGFSQLKLTKSFFTERLIGPHTPLWLDYSLCTRNKCVEFD